MPGFAAQYYGGIWGRRATLLSSWHSSVLCLKQSENVHPWKLVLWQFLTGNPLWLLPFGPPYGVRYWWYLGEAVKIILLSLQTLYHAFGCIRNLAMGSTLQTLYHVFGCFRNLAMALTHSVIKVWPIMLKSMTLLHVWEVRLHVGLHWLNVCLHWLNVGPQA